MSSSTQTHTSLVHTIQQRVFAQELEFLIFSMAKTQKLHCFMPSPNDHKKHQFLSYVCD